MKTARSLDTSEATADIAMHLERPAQPSRGARCSCATSLAQVEAAWRLVYQRYTQMGLIDENPFGIHTAPTAIGNHTCVVWGPEGPETGYTMSLFCDNPMGLALDSVYPEQLDTMRREGRRLLEVGMLADRRESLARGIWAVCDMMRWAVHYALLTGFTDVVVGVHPRHAPFYLRYYRFQQFAPTRSYPMVRNHPVVPLHIDVRAEFAKENLPRGLADARDNPIPHSEFAHRFDFNPQRLRGSSLEAFLKTRHGFDPCKTTDRAVEPVAFAYDRLGGRLGIPAGMPLSA